MGFVDGYITAMSKELPNIKTLMSTHLQELMEDGERYGWPAVRAYHAACLRHNEQGWVAWANEEKKMNLCRPLVWHQEGPFKPALCHTLSGTHSTSMAGLQQSTQKGSYNQ